MENLSYIEHKKAFLGLVDYLVYKPTNSRLNRFTRYYSPDVREQLKNLFALDDDKLSQNLSNYSRLEQVANGNIMIDGYVSKDKQFVSLRMYQYMQLDYHPVSRTVYLQGDAAKQAAVVFAL